MTEQNERFILSGIVHGEFCVVDETYHSKSDHSVSFVSSGRTIPTLEAAVRLGKTIDPRVRRIRVMTSDAFDLMTLCIFWLIDGRWQSRTLR